jgi:hypothetical protein
MREHRFFRCPATAALAVVAVLCVAGCKTPPPTAAPMYGAATVAPPATGMVGQPAPYGTYAAPQQAVAYPPPPAGSPMPGPATSWQGVSQPAAPSSNSWSWSQAGSPTAQPVQQPSLQQYTNQLSGQTQQFANQTQQSLAQQQQQMTNQLQNTANQYQQGFNNQVNQYNNQLQQGMQNTQQQLNQQMQQATNQMQQAVPQMQTGPQTQTVNGNWWPFTDPNSLPPARATPAAVPRY